MDSFTIIIWLACIIFLPFLFRRIIILFKGKVGEKVVASNLDRLPGNQYKVLNNITFPTPNGSSQIDHLIVSIYGIFVIETKNYKGWIYGGESAEYWTQNIHGHKYQLFSPILQNAGHVKAIRRVLKEFEPLTITPIVAFSRRTRIKVKAYDAYVVYWDQVRRIIKQYDERHLSWEQVNAICDKIQSVQLESSKETRKQHKKNVRSAVEQKNEAVSSGKCPRCGGTLVLRNSKYGPFYGCSNYPSCNFILNK